jgi:DNA-3-methyladenine glycosylase I
VSRAEILVGDDERPRCGWIGTDPAYRRYHDEEWGTPLHGDRPLFEKICLEGFQAGLSWITILRRRPGFRESFDGFDIDTVAAYGEEDVERLMADDRIIRNRAKVLAAIGNARVTVDLVRDHPGALDELIWSFAPSAPRPRPRTWADIPAVTAESEALSAALRKLGFRFVGPTTMYALMQSAGLVDDHLTGCWRSRER